MALGPDRYEVFVNTDYFMNETGEAGSVVVFDLTTTGVGAALDDANSVVKLPDVANGSGEVPAGILMCDVVDKDLTKTHLNAHKREVQVGGKVGICMDPGNVVTTNKIASGSTPSPGAAAYFTTDGLLTTVATNSTKIGRWRSAKDASGFAKLEVNVD